jgi:hypothetical protein
MRCYYFCAFDIQFLLTCFLSALALLASVLWCHPHFSLTERLPFTMEPGSGSASTLKPSSKRPRATIRDNDITVLYTPSAEAAPIAADIIFVHGLQGHPQETWQAHTESPAGKRSFFGLGKRKRGECGKSSDTVFWPTDILPDNYANVRILTYGYDSHVSHYFKGPANKLNL